MAATATTLKTGLEITAARRALFTVFAVPPAVDWPPRERANPRANVDRLQATPQLRQATVKPGQVPTERHRATPSDAREVTGGQGVAGSNPAVPTGSEIFSNIVTPHKSQQKSQLVVQRLSNRRTPIGCHGVLTGARANTAGPTKPHSQGVKDHRAAHLPGDPANREPVGAIRAHRPYSTCGTRAGQGPQARPAHAAADARRPA